MNTNKMLRVQHAVFILQEHTETSANSPFPARKTHTAHHDLGRGATYLASSIDNLGRVILTLVFDYTAECVFNGRVITLDKMVIDKAHGER